MKKISLMTLAVIALLLSAVAFAQKGWTLVSQDKLETDVKPVAENAIQAPNGHFQKVSNASHRAAIASLDVIVGDYVWENKTASQRAEDPSTLEATDGMSAVSIAKGTEEGTIVISGMFPYDLTATVDLTTGEITIPIQAAGSSSYGAYNVRGLFYYAGDETYQAGWYYDNLYATVGEDGVITLDDTEYIQRILTEGDYAGYSLTPYWLPGSTLTPANGEMSWGEGEAEEKVPVILEQSADGKTVVVKNFGDFGATVNVTMNPDLTFAIPSQVVYQTSSATYKTYAATADDIAGETIEGTGTEDALTFGSNWTAWDGGTSWFGSIAPATIKYTDGTKFAYPGQDIDISPATGTDISDAITEAQGAAAKLGNVKITLAKDGAYTLSKTIKAGGNITINGNGATIDASTGDNIIGIEGVNGFAKKADGTDSDHSLVNAITFKDVTITGMTKALVRDLMTKTLLETLTIDNCVIQVSNAKPFIDFDGRGYVGKVVVKNSTLWAATPTEKNFAKYGSRPKSFNEALNQEFDVQNSTIVNIAAKADFSGGQNFNNLKQNGTANNIYTLKNNIFVNCGKSGQVVIGFNNGQTSPTPVWDVDKNAFNWNGADVSAAEVSKAGKKNDVDIVQNIVPGVIAFASETAIADGNFKLANCAQNTSHIGDPRWLDATAEPEGEDITISPASGDISDALFSVTGAVNKKAKNITINLTADAKYTVSTSIVAPASLTINGAAGATVDASALSDNFITLSGSSEFAKKADGTTVSDHYLVDAVTIKDVTITGLTSALIKDSQKTLLNTLTIDNSIIEMPAAQKNVIDFNGKGYVAEVFVKNSTIYANGKNTGFFVQYGSRPKNLWTKDESDADVPGIYTKQNFDIQNSTIVNIANGKNVCDLKQNGTAQNGYVLKNNIFVDFGKSGQVVVGFNKGQASANPVWDVDGNVFNYGGADKSAAEVEKAGKNGEENIVKNSYAGRVLFVDAAAGDFNFTFLAAPETTAPTAVGDPRWTLTAGTSYTITIGEVKNGSITTAITYAAEGEKVYATLTPDAGYAIDNIPTIKNAAGDDVTEQITFGEDELYFVMPAFNVTVDYEFSKLYTITLPTETTNGTVTLVKPAEGNQSVAGKNIKIKVTDLASGYKVVAKNGDEEIALTEGDHTEYDYYFTMPEGDVTISIEVATGISKIAVDASDDIFSDGKPVYNLSGQRVFKGYKGIVIKNGKKVVIK